MKKLLVLCAFPFLTAYKPVTHWQTSIFPTIIKYEGSRYTNDPRDPGGPTKYGITLKWYRSHIDPRGTAQDIKDLTKYEAGAYYKKYFWERYGANDLTNRRLQITVLLAQINLGPYRPSRILQKMTNEFCHSKLKLDGILGQNSINHINRCKYVWPGYPYILYYFYAENKHIGPVWKWAKRGLTNRIFYGVKHHGHVQR